MKNSICVWSVFFIGSLMVSSARGAVVTGTVTDAAMPTGQPVAFIKVDIRSLSPDMVIQSVSTDVAGVYTAIVPDSTDIYAVAKWEFTLRPASFYQNKVVRLLDKVPGPPTTTYMDMVTSPMNSGTGTLNLNITMDQVQPVGLTELFTQIELAMDYVRLNKGSVNWQPNYDIPVHIDTNGADRFDPADQSLYLSSGAFDGTGSTFDRVTLYHEANHLIHYYLNGMTFPPTEPGCACHSLRTEEDRNCAFQEAWASYVGQLTAEFARVMDPFYTLYRDPNRRQWRGGASTDCDSSPSDNTPAPTGYDGCPSSCVFESGEIVEGAVAGTLFGWHDITLFEFEDNLRVVFTDAPANIRDFADSLAIFAGGVDSVGALATFTVLQEHGIVYSRARFRSTPIVIDEPPDMAAPDDGNVKEIEGTLFIRGKAIAQFEPVPPADLGVFLSYGITEVGLEFGPATDDLDGFPGFTNFTPFVPAGPGTLEFDTTGPGWNDGDWDIVLVAKNIFGFTDNSQPNWVGDGNDLVNTNEKYFKVVGGWYDKDRDPTTPAMDPAKEGKVIVDNTPPTVSGFRVGP